MLQFIYIEKHSSNNKAWTHSSVFWPAQTCLKSPHKIQEYRQIDVKLYDGFIMLNICVII